MPFSNEHEVLGLAAAWEHLENHEILITEKQTIVVKRKDKIFVKSGQWSCVLDKKEFLSLFDQQKFIVYERNSSEDPALKDEEYYQWREHHL